MVTTPLAAQEGEKRIALTFSDLPARGPLGYWEPREISNLIVRKLEKREVPAAGFVVQEKIDDKPITYVVLEDWVKRGHLLGNQTYSRVDYHALPYDDFVEHLRDGQKDIRRLGKIHGFNYRYLRFPLLHQGETKKKRKSVLKLLRRAGYEIAHVTVKTSDHRFIPPYLANQGDSAKLARLKELFLAHIAESLDYAESQSQKVFGRNIAHILQLRAGIATGAFLEDLLDLLSGRGYTFITLPQALEDPAFRTEEEYFGPLGLSFIDRVAATRGIPFQEFQGELRRDDVESWLQEEGKR